MTHIDDGGYGRTMDTISERVARAHEFAPIEDGRAMWCVLWLAPALRFGKPAIIIVTIELVAIVAYFVGFVFM